MAAILMYHRVSAACNFDPWELNVSPENFIDHLDLFQSNYEVISIDQLCEYHQSGYIPEDAVCITFDDGYHDNLSVAKPLIEHAEVPATIFLATGFLDLPSYWWDRLSSVFSQINAEVLDSAHAADILGPDIPMTLDRVWGFLRDLDHMERDETLDRIALTLGVQQIAQPVARPMTRKEAKHMPSSLISIGAHTVNHVWLPVLEESRMLEEINASIQDCQEISGKPVFKMAYPYGAYNDKVTRVAESLGINCAVTTTAGRVTVDTPLLALPRICVPNLPANELAKRLYQL